MDIMKEIEKDLNLADRHLWDLIDRGVLIDHIKYLIEENKKYREALDRAHVLLERYESTLNDAGPK